MPSSLFRRVTRYPAAQSLDPRENRLTEVTAAVIEHVDGLGPSIVEYALEAGVVDADRRALDSAEVARRQELQALSRSLTADRVSVNTQVATSQGRFVDLEVLLRPPVGADASGLLVWVEVKHGADLHGDQLDAYLRDIRMRPVPERVQRVVVLLVPRGWAPEFGAVPPEILMADWQGVGRVVKAAAALERSPEQHWLLSQYTHYLKEEGLTDPDALTTVSALALMEADAAYSAVAGICEYADEVTETGWGPRGDHQRTRGNTPAPAFGAGYWANRDPHRQGDAPHPNWRGAWFEWGLRDTASMQGLEDPRGSWAFTAGATLITKDNPTKVAANEEWYARRVADGFRYFWIGGYYRLARLRYPDELLAATTLEAQGRELGQWVLDAFTALVDDPPPA